MVRKKSFMGGFLIFSLVGAYLVYQVDRDFGRVNVPAVSFITEENQPMTAKFKETINEICTLTQVQISF